MVYLRIHQMLYSEEEWLTEDPVLNKGEMACTEVDEYGYVKIKIGDGASKWSELKYVIDFTSMAAAQEAVDAANAAAEENMETILTGVENLTTYLNEAKEAAETATTAAERTDAAEGYMNAAAESAAAAKESETAAAESAAEAAGCVEVMGVVSFLVDTDGHVYMLHAERAGDISFALLENGHMEATY